MLDRIKASLPSLAPAEQRVAQLVLSDPRRFAQLPVSELAARAEVSKPTVIRFCRSMGYDGLSDFKLKLVGTVSEGVPFIHRSVDVDDKTGDVLVKVIDNTVAAFLKYRNDASHHAIERGHDIASCTMIAFGGAAPLHAGRLAQKLGTDANGAGLPFKWHGCVLLLSHMAMIVGLSLLLADRPLVMLPVILIIALAPMPIYAARTEGGWKWRNGKD